MNTTAAIIGILLIVIIEAMVIVWVVRRMGPVRQDPGKDDWRRFHDEWQRRQ